MGDDWSRRDAYSQADSAERLNLPRRFAALSRPKKIVATAVAVASAIGAFGGAYEEVGDVTAKVAGYVTPDTHNAHRFRTGHLVGDKSACRRT